jgi:hypothetical protein
MGRRADFTAFSGCQRWSSSASTRAGRRRARSCASSRLAVPRVTPSAATSFLRAMHSEVTNTLFQAIDDLRPRSPARRSCTCSKSTRTLSGRLSGPCHCCRSTWRQRSRCTHWPASRHSAAPGSRAAPNLRLMGRPPVRPRSRSTPTVVRRDDRHNSPRRRCFAHCCCSSASASATSTAQCHLARTAAPEGGSRPSGRLATQVPVDPTEASRTRHPTDGRPGTQSALRLRAVRPVAEWGRCERCRRVRSTPLDSPARRRAVPEPISIGVLRLPAGASGSLSHA